jgi:hypothetical protein
VIFHGELLNNQMVIASIMFSSYSMMVDGYHPDMAIVDLDMAI